MYRMLPPIPAGLLGLVLLMVLAWQVSGRADAHPHPQPALDAKPTPVRGPGANVASSPSDLAAKRVLILHSFGYAQPFCKIIDQSITESFIQEALRENAND